MTIHRDLDELEQQGVLREVRGATGPRPSSLFESSVRYRVRAAREEKEAVCRFAMRQVEREPDQKAPVAPPGRRRGALAESEGLPRPEAC